MKKKYLIILLFSLLILNITANAITIYLVDDDTGIKLGRESICVDGYGNLHTVFIDTNSGWLEHSVSTDDGETWTDYEVVQVNNVAENIMGYVIDIDSNHHVVTTLDDGADTYVYYYGGGNDDDWYNPVTINSYSDLGHYPSAGIGISRNSDIYIFYDEIESDPTEDFWLKCRIHSHGQSNTVWGSEQNAYVELNGFTNDPDGWGISSDTFSNGDVAVIWILECPTDTAELRISVFDVSEEVFNDDLVINLDYTGEASFNPECDIAIDEDDNIHIAYTNEEDADTDGYIDYIYGTWNGTGFTETNNETVYHIEDEDNLHPSISYTEDGNIHIMWYGQNSYVTTDHIMVNTGTFGNWEGREFCHDLNTDTNIKPSLVYQNFPSWAMLYNGYIGIYENTTNDEIYMTDSGDKIFFGSQPPSEYEECRSPNSIFVIYKVFDEGTNYIYMNTSGQFNIRITELAGLGDIYLRIVNETGTVVQSKTWYYNELVFDGNSYFFDTILFYPELWMDTGLYSIDMRWSGEEWEEGLICPFEVLSSEVEGNWGVKTDKASYDYYAPENIVDLYVKIPSGQKGRIEVVDSSDPSKIIRSLGDILGIGTYYKYDNWWTLDSSNQDKTYIINLYNTTNTSNIEFRDSWTFIVGKGGPVTPPVTEEETNFWIGIGIILAFTFIGVGVATRFDESNTQVAIILLMSTIGGIVSYYYSLIPAYAPFLIGLLFIGYIVSQIYGGK